MARLKIGSTPFLRMAVALLAMSLFLAGCSGSDSTDAAEEGEVAADDSDENDAGEESSADADADADGDSEGSGDAEETVVTLPAFEPASLDPAVGGTGFQEYQNLYEPLVDAYAKDGEIRPLAAESWDVSDDGLTYTFHLREGLKWSDGEPVTANDFRYAWLRQIDPEVASYTPDLFFEIQNAEAYLNGEVTDPDEVGIAVLDDLTLEVTLAQPAAYWLRVTGTNAYFPVRQDVIEEHGDAWTEPETFVGNGPYMLDQWVRDQRLEFVQNPHYAGPWADTRLVDRVIYRTFQDPWNEALTPYEAGEIDAALIPGPDLERVEADEDMASNVLRVPLAGGSIMVFDTQSGPTDDVLVRQAITMATDFESLANDVLRGAYEPAVSFSPPQMSSHDPDSFPAFDPEGARALLAEAGYPDGEGFPTLELTTWTLARENLISQALAAMWSENLSIDVSIQSFEPAAMTEWRNTRAEEDFDVYLALQWADLEDPRFFHVSQLDPAGNVRHSGYDNPDYVAALDAALSAGDQGSYDAAWREAEALVNRDLPIVTTVYEARPWIVSDALSNFQEVTTEVSEMIRVAQPPGLQVSR